MSEERFLVTGSTGCIGIWVLRNLVRDGTSVTALTVDDDFHRLPLVLSGEEISHIQFVKANIANHVEVENAFKVSSPTHVIHLAGLQLPFCRANPTLGAQVNVVGTVNIFEAAKRAGVQKVVYASSTAVYGLNEEYPAEPLAHRAPLKPRSHYGVYKQANEGTARVYWLEDKISSIGLRPYVVFGAGRDQGMTSTPTKAMLAAAAGKPYNISYGGRYGFQYTDDTARAFIQAARSGWQGADVFNLGGETVSTPQVIQAIEQAEPTARGSITFTDTPLPFPAEVDNQALVETIGALRFTPLAAAIAETMMLFRHALKNELIKPEE